MIIIKGVAVEYIEQGVVAIVFGKLFAYILSLGAVVDAITITNLKMNRAVVVG